MPCIEIGRTAFSLKIETVLWQSRRACEIENIRDVIGCFRQRIGEIVLQMAMKTTAHLHLQRVIARICRSLELIDRADAADGPAPNETAARRGDPCSRR